MSMTEGSQMSKGRDCVNPMPPKGQNLQETTRSFTQVKTEKFVLYYSVESLASVSMEVEEETGKN